MDHSSSNKEELSYLEKYLLSQTLKKLSDNEMEQLLNYIEEERKDLIETKIQLRVDIFDRGIFNALHE